MLHDVILTLAHHAFWLIPLAALVLVMTWLLDRIGEML